MSAWVHAQLSASTASRRGFLCLAGAAGLSAVAGSLAFATPAPRLDDLLQALIDDREMARALAARCLAQAGEVDWRRRLDALARSAPRDVAELRAAVDQARRADFAREDVVIVDGWVLARSEAETLVLAAATA